MEEFARSPAPLNVAPPLQMMQMALAFWMSRSIYAAAEIGLADHLKDGSMSAQELAEAVGAHVPSLARLLRFLCGVGVLVEDPSQRFALTPLGATLRTDVPGSMRALVRGVGLPISWQAWGEIVHAVKTGQPGVDKIAGEPFFNYLSKHPTEAAIFNEFVACLYMTEPALITGTYDFSRMHKIVDLGGGSGSLIAAILLENPALTGILFDLPHVVGAARDRLASQGIGDRCECVAGSFFEAVPEGGDVYILSHIIHDWDDERSLAILECCRTAMRPSARLLLVESVLLGSNEPDPGTLVDMAMLVIIGGLERTAEDYRSLLQKAGFRLTRIVATGSSASVIEAMPV